MIVHDVPRLIGLTLMTASAGGCGWIFGCGKDNSSETPLSVSDWNVTPERYDAIRMAASSGGGTGGFGATTNASTDTGGTDTGGTDTGGTDNMAWDELSAEGQCNLACAYALGELYAYQYQSYYQTLTIHTCELTIPTADADGTLSCTATRYINDVCIGGRRPLGWQAERAPIDCAQQQLDGMAEMEQVSITAFLELAAQLDNQAAPAAFVERCRAAADDEIRHVALLVELGATPPAAPPAPAPSTTSLIDIALHNAVEGCVTETWAALLARHQSMHAPDSSVRRAFARIADDEARHAQLAWELHAWLIEQLDPATAATIEAARTQALAQLDRTAAQQALILPRAVRDALGLPSPQVAAALARDFGQRLRARPAA